jgi:ABC-type transport system involved in Fe-S cluster assembly fused permease/ATPase subunit
LAGSKQKKKKDKLEDVQVEQKDKLLGLKLWSLRALVLKSLHKCFLYDNDQKILDSSNFQVSWFIVQVFPFFVVGMLLQVTEKKSAWL